MFFLVVISLIGSPMMFMSSPIQTMTECMEARELVVEQIGRPIINYQAICIHKLQES